MAAVVTVLILNSVFHFEISRFFIARPNITFDAAEEYNRVTKPENFDPAQNAAPLYERALKSLTPMPEFLKDIYPIWSCVDLTEQQTVQLKDWIAENGNAFDLFRQGAQKPYFWKPYQFENDFFSDLNELMVFKELLDPFIWQIRQQILDGEVNPAFEDILLLFEASNHFAPPKCLLEQLIGVIARTRAGEMAFVLLDRVDINTVDLESFSQRLQSTYDACNPLQKYSEGEAVFARNWIQKVFTDDGKGNGRLIPSELVKYDMFTTWPEALWYAVVHPNRKETEQFFRDLPEFLNSFYEITPYQMHKENEKYTARINEHYKRFDYFDLTAPKVQLKLPHRLNVRRDALLAVVAILRYQKENGSFPPSLQQLVDVGYLRAVPMDPYSDGPLVYRVTGDDFLLYSLGEDFTDNGGTPLSDRNSETDGFDLVFWPQ